MLLTWEQLKQKQLANKQEKLNQYLSNGDTYKTCINGHLQTPDNVYTYKSHGRSVSCCDTCRRLHHSQYKRINGKLIKVSQIMNPNNGRRRIQAQPSKYYYKQKRTEILTLLGGKCIKCSFSDFRALQIDHINGNGLKELRTLSTSEYFQKVINSIQNNLNEYQLLCANCNWIKRIENNENPGQI